MWSVSEATNKRKCIRIEGMTQTSYSELWAVTYLMLDVIPRPTELDFGRAGR
jgi:hypothetical protein